MSAPAPTETAPDAADPAGPPAAAPVHVIEYYRRDQASGIVSAVAFATVFAVAGSLVVAVTWIRHAGPTAQMMAAFVGIVLVMAAPAIVILRLRKLLAEESYVSLRSDGIVVHRGATETFVAWDAVAEARFDESVATLRIERTDGAPLALADRWAGIDGPTLAAHVNDLKRKAAFGLPPVAPEAGPRDRDQNT